MKGQLLGFVGISCLCLSLGTQGQATGELKTGQNSATANSTNLVSPRTVKVRLEWKQEVPATNTSQFPDSEVVELSTLEGSTVVSTNPVAASNRNLYRQCILNPSVSKEGTFTINLSVFEWVQTESEPGERLERLTTTIIIPNGTEKIVQTRSATIQGKESLRFSVRVTPTLE
jgi:hypothetical protein